LNSNLITAEKFSDDLNLVGDVVDIDLEKIIECQDNGVVPIVPPIGFTKDGVMLNINADNVANFIVENINPLKYIVLNEMGGIYDEYLIKKNKYCGWFWEFSW